MTEEEIKKEGFILLVDDDETSNYINKRIVSKFYLPQSTFMVPNGMKAIEFLESSLAKEGNLPDIIFLDLNMPVMDGFQVLDEMDKKLIDYRKKTKVVILTSSSNPKDIDQAKGYPIHAYLNKPLTVEKMKQYVLVS